ncbi:hypothetical protein BDQ94DRAFT_148464 [Aspergillus welwitschiae]|uniref:Uncharacterized protein n=1 Tax=Aspergillus welwitschiae TaxID=1341132 RepID=A0A3F3PU47_9EURO|nr:hypothetical protein BDQ94DRAFT_148464 [Aspergillus welwitschiae]RDH30457.1 hypothetical protein BDQ94DRAFT_148464 [Aspergillus welwitschiae]
MLTFRGVTYFTHLSTLPPSPPCYQGYVWLLPHAEMSSRLGIWCFYLLTYLLAYSSFIYPFIYPSKPLFGCGFGVGLRQSQRLRK